MPDKEVTWSIKRFPKSVKDMFVGMCKMKGKRTAEVLEYITLRWVQEQKAKDKTHG